MTSEESALLLFEEAMAFTYSAALRAAAALDLADHLADRPRTPGELAAACGADADGLHRILRLLAGRGVVREDAGGRFHLTPKGDALRSTAPMPARTGVLMFTDELFWSTSQRLAASLTDADPSFEKAFGMPMARYFEDAGREALFYEGMAAVSDAENPLIARSCELPARGTVVDVGGRSGAFLLTVLRERPGLRGVLFDLHPAADGRTLDLDGVAGRWETVQGDFFEAVPPGDVLVLKRILHNWDDDDCVRILESCRRALAPGGRVLVVDAIIPAGNAPHQSKEMDLMMLAALTGRERTADQLEPLFAAAGLRLDRVVPTPSVMSIAEGVAA
ncbi:MAG TPA: methyltransferase [Solirubrobacteraceae bacterium]|jgi:SAM-dependent methyltransferase|nr:methyltransferase [Solirubrobacteraceae bacterium]